MTEVGVNMAIDNEQRFIFLGSGKGLFKEPLPPGVSVCHDRSEVEAAVRSPTKRVTWISFTRSFTDILLQKAVGSRADLRGSHLITLTPPRSESIPALLGLFHPVFGLGDAFQWLPKEELVEAITRDDARDRFIGGSVDAKAKTLTLLRGDITAMVAPFSLFPRSGDGTAPDFAGCGLPITAGRSRWAITKRRPTRCCTSLILTTGAGSPGSGGRASGRLGLR